MPQPTYIKAIPKITQNMKKNLNRKYQALGKIGLVADAVVVDSMENHYHSKIQILLHRDDHKQV